MADNDVDYRRGLVAALKRAGWIRTLGVEDAFANVARHMFIPGVPLAEAYADRAHSVKMEDGVMISSSSQPAIVAEMLEQLEPRPGERVLEMGRGAATTQRCSQISLALTASSQRWTSIQTSSKLQENA